MAPSTASTSLTDTDRALITRARELATLPHDGHCVYTGVSEPVAAGFTALGRAKHLLAELADLAERLGAR